MTLVTTGHWSQQANGQDRVGLCMYKRNDTYSTWEWQRLRSICAFDTCTSFALQRFCDRFCLPETLICGKYDQTRLFSMRIIALSMVYLYSKVLESLERCMCEKEVIRTACASLIDRCGGAPGTQYV